MESVLISEIFFTQPLDMTIKSKTHTSNNTAIKLAKMGDKKPNQSLASLQGSIHRSVTPLVADCNVNLTY